MTGGEQQSGEGSTVGVEQAGEAITAIVSDPETRRFLFIAESERGGMVLDAGST